MPPTDSGDNLTAVLYGIEDLRLENQKIPEIADDRKLRNVFICVLFL